jgi:hypothetical protein
MCKKFPGYLRVAIADPQPERRFFRRGWVSFERNVNIKEICWNLNNIRLRDCDMGAIVNRDLSRRIRPVSGLTQHKAVSVVISVGQKRYGEEEYETSCPFKV